MPAGKTGRDLTVLGAWLLWIVLLLLAHFILSLDIITVYLLAFAGVLVGFQLRRMWG